MCMFGGFAVILLLSAQTLTAISKEVTPYHNYSMEGFPPPPPGFRDLAQRLMSRCSSMGYPLPRTNQTSSAGEAGDAVAPSPFLMFLSLLSSMPDPPLVQPNDNTTVDWDMILTDRLLNCSDLLCMIEVTKNITDGSLCFLRAFLAPLTWGILVTNGTNLTQSVYALFLWGAEPLLKDAPPPLLVLPLQLSTWQLNDMMELLSKVFDSLSEDQRQQVLRWVKPQVAQNPQDCTQESCPPRKGWLLRADMMKTMGRYLFLLPSSELKAVQKEQLCSFFWAPRFPCSFCRAGRAPTRLGRMFLRKVTDHCLSNNNDFLGKLGPLACFYRDTSSLNTSVSKTLLGQLRECRNSGGIKLRKRLVMKLISEEGDSPSALLWLLGLGPSVVSALSLPRLALLPSQALRDALPSLRQGEWTPSQARTLARTLLQGKESVSGEELLFLGSIARGVRISMLRRFKPKGILGDHRLTALTKKFSALQKTALLEGLLGDMDVSELVDALPGPLFSRLSLSALKRASLRSLDQLEGRELTRAQAAFLVMKILGKRLRPQDIRKLGSALQGVTCEMIDSTNHTEVFTMVEALEQSKSRPSRTQMRCSARKLFESLKRKRASYFANITGQELRAIPATMLLYLPTELIAGLPDSVCSYFLEKMSRADLPLLPLNSAIRVALIEKALGCLKKNLSSLTPDDITSLGGLVLELQPWRLALLSRPALNATLLALAQGRQMHPYLRGPIRKHLEDLYGKPSDWSLDTMTLLGPLLLLVNDNSTFRSLPYKPWLGGALMDLLDSQPPLTVPQPPEFNTEPDLSDLRWKIFSLAITPVSPHGNAKYSRTNHDRIEPSSPSLQNVVDAGEGNMFWTPEQLEQMSDETFREGVSDLGVVHGYTPLQLQVLRNKTIQAFGEAGSLSEDQVLQLGCITQGFSPAELQEIGITSLDSLELLSPCGWDLDQSEVVLQGFLGGNNLTIGELGVVEVVGLGEFICGMSPQEVEELNNDTFGEAVMALGAVRCSQEVTEKLKDRAVLLFGEVENWTQAEVNLLGNIIAGLQASELQRLAPSVFPFISQTAIPLILPDRLAALSVAQLLAMGPDNAAMVTTAQRKALGRLQLEALDKALGLENVKNYISATTPPVSPLSPMPYKSGTASLRMMENGIFWQILLLLLMYIQ